jgi:hypothetical protein
MGDRKQFHLEEIDYRIAVSRFESAFEACTRLQDDDREALLRDMARRMLSQVTHQPPQSTAGSESVVALGAEPAE